MRLHAFATDYDGTLAEDGVASPEALEALRRLRRSGRRPMLITGRTMDEWRADYSRWMREAIGDGDLSELVRRIENDRALDSRAARDRVIEAVRDRYTAPA